MKKLILAGVFALVCLGTKAQVQEVDYSIESVCNAQMFFGVRTIVGTDIYYRLTVDKTALPGETMQFDMVDDLSSTYVPASTVGLSMGPLVFGIVTPSGAYYMDAATSSQTAPAQVCESAEGSFYLTRDGEFHRDAYGK